jgi:hypothetical protein
MEAVKKTANNRGKIREKHLQLWMRQFILLRKEHGSELVGKVLDWYTQHIGEEFVPVAYSGQSFKVKFQAIKRAMETTDFAEVEPTYLAQKMADGMTNLNPYPIEILSRLPVLIQKTMDSWDKFTESCVKYATYGNPTDRDMSFLESIIILHSHNFVPEWWSLVSHKLHGLKTYAGNVNTWVFHPDSQLFLDSFWRRWSMDRSGVPTTFDRLLEEINKL